MWNVSTVFEIIDFILSWPRILLAAFFHLGTCTFVPLKFSNFQNDLVNLKSNNRHNVESFFNLQRFNYSPSLSLLSL